MEINKYLNLLCTWFKTYVKLLFSLIGIGISRHKDLVLLRQKANSLKDSLAISSFLELELIRALNPAYYELMISLLNKSKSQLKQDLFVLSETKYKTGGFFVEIGATNGVDLSNTHLLETEFEWEGILAEPAIVWAKQLLENRPTASIETLCIWKDSNSSLIFNQTDFSELSTISDFSDKDFHANSRGKGIHYKVDTISLNDLLKKYNAPQNIDYLSIDTEGSEYAILSAFDFTIYNIKIITVEHNYTPQRELIFNLLTSNGYTRKHTNISDFDDWYIKK